MHLVVSTLLRMLPVALPLASWRISEGINANLACSAIGKSPEPCFFQGTDIQPIIDAMAWWGMMLWMPGLIISGILLAYVLRLRLPPPWGKAIDRGQVRN